MAKAREIATQFPRLRASLDTAADCGAAPENTFEFGLQAPQLIARPTPADKNARKPPRPGQEPRATSPNQVIAAANTRRLGRGARTLPRCPVSRRELARAKTMSCSKNRTSSTLPLVGISYRRPDEPLRREPALSREMPAERCRLPSR
jgi:hypothetical protein